MGWNEGYSIYEEIVIGLYDKNVLTQDVLQIVLNPFRDTDMDHGGSADLKTHDGLNADEVVVKVAKPEFWDNWDKRRNDILQKSDCSTWEQWYEKFTYKTKEYKEESNLSDEFHDTWASITETW